jgi:PAS domain S-box-containing protein
MSSDKVQTRDLAQRLSEAEATLEALLAGQIDAVVDSKSMTPVLLSKAQEALRESEERYRRIVETTNEGVWMIGAQNKTTFMNRRMAQMLGCEADMGLGRSPDEFLDEAGRAHLAEHIKRGVDTQVEVRYIRADGTSVWGRRSPAAPSGASDHRRRPRCSTRDSERTIFPLAMPTSARRGLTEPLVRVVDVQHDRAPGDLDRRDRRGLQADRLREVAPGAAASEPSALMS